MADVVIRGGTILDGLGGEPFEADLAIDGSKISEIGQNVPRATRKSMPQARSSHRDLSIPIPTTMRRSPGRIRFRRPLGTA